jgi:hypothetical protein
MEGNPSYILRAVATDGQFADRIAVTPKEWIVQFKEAAIVRIAMVFH